MNNKNIIKKIILALLIIILVCLYFFNPQVKYTIDNSLKTLSSADINKVVEYIKSFGPMALIVSFFLMVLQSVVAPVPAFIITFANAIIFGWVKGAILSWSSAMVGAILCFYIARVFGRDTVCKITTNTALNQVEKYFNKYGGKTILICRLLPFVSFDLVSYFAGLTSIDLLSFLIATGVGQLPATIMYSYVGGMLTGGAKLFVTALLILFSISIFIIIIKQIYEEKNNQ